MSQSTTENRQWLLAERPVGEPDDNTYRFETGAVPASGNGEMLLRTVYLSLDPYMRGRMSDAPSYVAPYEIGDVLGAGTVARVVTSNVEGFAPGDWVLSMSGWQDYAVSNGEGVVNLGAHPQHPSWAVGVMGMPGFTAWAGLTGIGKPKAAETLVVAAATGPVGATVGQIGKLLGCRVVGIAGGAQKCSFAVEELGFDACLDHRAEDFAEQLAKAVPDGIDIYFENVGGKVFDAVLPLLNSGARVPLCGLSAVYNATSLPDGPDRLGYLMGQLLRKRVTVRGFICFQDFGHLYPEFQTKITEWVSAGKVRYKEHMVDGLENAPAAFLDMLTGRSFGKTVIRVGPDDL
jgi:NADPH-dependent curcumin reductase